MISLKSIHHIAIIGSDYEQSKLFYTQILGLKILREVYREERKSYKLDLALQDQYIIELFSFPESPKRLTRPEATGLRHLAFEVDDIQKTHDYFTSQAIWAEEIRRDEFTGKQFFFINDPDNLPIEFYESSLKSYQQIKNLGPKI